MLRHEAPLCLRGVLRELDTPKIKVNLALPLLAHTLHLLALLSYCDTGLVHGDEALMVHLLYLLELCGGLFLIWK